VAESIIKKAKFSNIISYTGTTDASGNLTIPKSTLNPISTQAILAFAVGGYASALLIDSSQYMTHMINYAGQPLASRSVTVYLAV
jgi:hypothetical protein